jgi:hypothetical protein
MQKTKDNRYRTLLRSYIIPIFQGSVLNMIPGFQVPRVEKSMNYVIFKQNPVTID